MLGRLDEAKATYEVALSHEHDHPYLHINRYGVAFLEGDVSEMGRQLAWAMGKPGAEDVLLSLESDTEAYSGRLTKARELSAKAADVAKRNDQKETAALWLLNSALRDAELNNSAQALQQLGPAMVLASNRDSQIVAALSLARAGERERAIRMADELARRSPLNTILRGYSLPAIRAAVELSRKRPENAIGLLEAASRYEMGSLLPSASGVTASFYPAYLRGEAYLNTGQGERAATEFQKLLNHRSIVGNFVLGALAHLQLGRAKVMSGDKEGARKAYQEFLFLWKDADPDVPILKEAKAEYAKLQ